MLSSRFVEVRRCQFVLFKLTPLETVKVECANNNVKDAQINRLVVTLVKTSGLGKQHSKKLVGFAEKQLFGTRQETCRFVAMHSTSQAQRTYRLTARTKHRRYFISPSVRTPPIKKWLNWTDSTLGSSEEVSLFP